MISWNDDCPVPVMTVFGFIKQVNMWLLSMATLWRHIFRMPANFFNKGAWTQLSFYVLTRMLEYQLYTILSILSYSNAVLMNDHRPIMPYCWYVAPRVCWESGRCPRHSDSPHSKDTGDISMGEFPIHFWKVHEHLIYVHIFWIIITIDVCCQL